MFSTNTGSFDQFNIEDLIMMDLELLAEYFAAKDISRDMEMDDPIRSPGEVATRRQGLLKTIRKKNQAV